MKRYAIFAGVLLAVLALTMVPGGVYAVPPAPAEPSTVWSDPADWYMTVQGLLDSDFYALYPFEHDKSLKIGFSKYGEMINGVENVGLEYWTVDPFAPPAGSDLGSVPKNLWLQGWLINITYTHVTFGSRNVWAMAQFSDADSWGGPWIRVDFPGDNDSTYGPEDPRDPGYIQDETPYMASGLVHGGRKTNGTAITYPIKVLYAGPRKFIAVLTTDLYDHIGYQTGDTSSDVPLVRIVFTIIFNKVKKQVIILKDIKSIIPDKTMIGQMFVQFSNRGEVDLGNEDVGYKAYAHFYTAGTCGAEDASSEGQTTVYGTSWELGQTASPSSATCYGPEPNSEPDTFDVAQVINPNVQPSGVVWYAAFWPSLSDWTIDGWPMYWRSIDAGDKHYIDLATATPPEPEIPYYIGEWDFYLDDVTGNKVQFRGVTVYGVVDKHDADDANMGAGHLNVIDREAIKYLLQEVFNPWDLRKALKNPSDDDSTKLSRWVEFFTIDDVKNGENITLSGAPEYGDWYAYSDFPERLVLICDGSATLLERDSNYTVYPGYENITLRSPVVSAMADGCILKVLYSTKENYDGDTYSEGRYEWIVVGRETKDGKLVPSAATLSAAIVSAAVKNKGFETWYMGMDIPFQRLPYVMSNFGSPYTDKEDFYFYGDQGGRPALKDHWCNPFAHPIPVASANLIAIGGPLANVLTEYVNEFVPAIYLSGQIANGLNGHVDPDLEGKVLASTCWSRNAYKNEGDVHYAVIATYKDLNGTVILEIWGFKAEDTYWAADWFHDFWLLPDYKEYSLQNIKSGITAIILELDYSEYSTNHYPDTRIVEWLGTISETTWPAAEIQQPPHPDP